MPQTFDDPDVRAAMRTYLDVAERLEAAAAIGGQARDLLDLAEAKAISGMALRKRLVELGWAPPARVTT